METTNVTLRMDKEIKESADKLFASLGLNFSSAVNLFVRKALRTQSIPFEVSLKNTTSPEDERIALLEKLLASPETQEKLSNIGKGSPFTYDSIGGTDEAIALVEYLER